MRRHWSIGSIFIMCLGVAGWTSAQDVRPLEATAVRVATAAAVQEIQPLVVGAPPPVGGAAAAGPTCDDLYYAKPPANPSPSDFKKVATCAQDIAKQVTALNTTTGSETNQNLIRGRVSYKRLQRWRPRGAIMVGEADKQAAQRELQNLDEVLRDALKKHDLFAQFSATLVTGATLTTAAASASDGDEESKPLAVGSVVWESRHFGDETFDLYDVSFGGRIGIEPVLTLIEPAAGNEGNDITTTHQTAFVWSFGVGARRQHRGINAESGVFVRTGSAYLTSVPSIIKRDGTSVVFVPVDNGSGKAAWRWEVGAAFDMFDTPLPQVHAEKGSTRPAFNLTLAWRRDERFQGSGALAQYERAAQRLVFGLTIDALQVVDRRTFGVEAKPFTLGFSVEHERSVLGSGNRVPSGTRYVIRGDLNLLKALTGDTE